jgi:tRNA splicing ligase
MKYKGICAVINLPSASDDKIVQSLKSLSQYICTYRFNFKNNQERIQNFIEIFTKQDTNWLPEI